MKLSGEVKGGRLIIAPVSWAVAMNQYANRRVTVEIDVEKPLRTIRANNRYWGVLVPLAGHHLSKTRDLPLSKDQVHYVLVAAFAGCEETALGLVPVRTSTMTTAQFSTYCELIQAWLAQEGYSVPDVGTVSPYQASEEGHDMTVSESVTG